MIQGPFGASIKVAQFSVLGSTSANLLASDVDQQPLLTTGQLFTSS